jgi:hypothetical protein
VEALSRNLRQPPAASPYDRTMHGAALVPGWLKRYRIGGTTAATLDRLLARCGEHGIDVVLVAPPLTAAHRRAYTAEIEGEFQTHVRRLTQAHQFRFVDYRTRLVDSFFLDNHHLLPEGGERFCAMLVRDVLR